MDLYQIPPDNDVLDIFCRQIPKTQFTDLREPQPRTVHQCHDFTILGLYNNQNDNADDDMRPIIARVVLHISKKPDPNDPIRFFTYWPDEDMVALGW